MSTGRYAPSPTGTLHLGNLRTAVAAWLFARSTNSDFLLRWEDLDSTAGRHHEASQLTDLAALGIDFDGPALRQSDRLDSYREVIDDLTDQGLTYPCWCSRRDVREAAAAPHGTPGLYTGTCRNLTRAEIADHERSGRPPARRLRTDASVIEFTDSLNGPQHGPVDDFVVSRGDGTPAYNLVVVVDDGFQGIREVVRGDDLLASTPRHSYLHRLLGLREPIWTHVPLVVDNAGDRLAKRDGSAGLDSWRDAGGSVDGLLAAFGRTLGIADTRATALAEMAAVFNPADLPREQAILDPSGPGLSLRF